MREKYESLGLADLKAIAKARGLKGTSTMKKAELVELMLSEDEKDKAEGMPVRKAESRSVRREEGNARNRKTTIRKERRNLYSKRRSLRAEASAQTEGRSVLRGRRKTPAARRKGPWQSLTAGLLPAVSWRSCPMGLVLSAVKIICPVTTMSMWRPARSGVLG